MKDFAKYLPVEGEIKIGDKARLKKKDGTWAIFTRYDESDPEWKQLEKEGRIGMQMDGTEYREWGMASTYPKVKLFLCSKNIQVGDKIRFKNNPMVLVDTEKEYDYDGLVEKMVKENPLLPDFMYKVIGEISPAATWVKEGDEFDEEQWDHNHGVVGITPLKILIKCPCCNKFN